MMVMVLSPGEMMKLPREIWIETFVDGVTDKSTPHIQGACLVRVQGLCCHVLSV